MPTYFIYSRKSSEAEDRQILSIDSQVSELKRFASLKGIKILEVLTEAKSAKAPGRHSILENVYIFDMSSCVIFLACAFY